MTTMPDVLSQVSSDEAVLLLYAAGELSATDRAAVDARLATEPDLRARLDAVTAADDAVTGAVARLDAIDPLPMTTARAAALAGRATRQWQARRDASVAAAEPVRVAGAGRAAALPWWAAPLAAAALAAVVGLALWSPERPVFEPGWEGPQAREAYERYRYAPQRFSDREFGMEVAQALTRSLESSAVVSGDSVDALADGERELAAVGRIGTASAWDEVAP